MSEQTKRLHVNGGGKVHTQPTVAVVRRRCPKCDKRRRVTETREEGRFYWFCHGCKHRWETKGIR